MWTLVCVKTESGLKLGDVNILKLIVHTLNNFSKTLQESKISNLEEKFILNKYLKGTNAKYRVSQKKVSVFDSYIRKTRTFIALR